MAADMVVLDNRYPDYLGLNGQDWLGLQAGRWDVFFNLTTNRWELNYQCCIGNIAPEDLPENDFVFPRSVRVPGLLEIGLYQLPDRVWTPTYKEFYGVATSPIPNFPNVSTRGAYYYGPDFNCISPGRYDQYFNTVPLYSAGGYVLRVVINAQRQYPESNYENNPALLPFWWNGSAGSSAVIYTPDLLNNFLPIITNLQALRDKNTIRLGWAGNGISFRVRRVGLDVVVFTPTFTERFPPGKAVDYSVSAINQFGEGIPVTVRIEKGNA